MNCEKNSIFHYHPVYEAARDGVCEGGTEVGRLFSACKEKAYELLDTKQALQVNLSVSPHALSSGPSKMTYVYNGIRVK